MSKFLKKKKIKTLIVDPSSAGRQEIHEILKKSGYKEFVSASNIKEAISILEVEQVDWVVTSLFGSEDENALKFIQLCNTHEELFSVRTSLLLAEDELDNTETAYALGAMSVHKKESTHAGLEGILLDVDRRMEVNEGIEAKVAASFFRDYLKELDYQDKLLKLEKSLVQIYRGDPYQLFNLGEANLIANNLERGYAQVKQAEMLDSDLSFRINELVEKYFDGDAPDTSEEGAVNILHLDKVLIVEPDDAVVNAIEDGLTSLGVKEIKRCSNGDEAIDWLQDNSDCSLVLHEWKLPSLTGPAFLQRIRSKQELLGIPLVVISSLIKDNDLPLLNEMGVTGNVKKPIDQKELLKTLFWTMKEFREPTNLVHLEQKIHLLLDGGDVAGAEVTLKEYLSQKEIKSPHKEILQAEFEFHQGNYENAKKLASHALKAGGNSLFLLNILGKSLMALRDFSSALRCFEKAKQMSPFNIERLCSMAEMHQELGDIDAASDVLDEAKQVDSGSEQVTEGEAKLAIENGETKKASKLLEDVESIRNIIAYMNNRAVALARCGVIDGGIELYEKALASIPENKKMFRPIVNYNRALAFIRADRCEEAVGVLSEVISQGQSKVYTKAENLKPRLENAINKGLPIILSKPKDQDNASSQSDEEGGSSLEGLFENSVLVSSAVLSPGDFCLYRVYIGSDVSEASKNLISKPTIRFKSRNAIARSATMGDGKLKKSEAA